MTLTKEEAIALHSIIGRTNSLYFQTLWCELCDYIEHIGLSGENLESCTELRERNGKIEIWEDVVRNRARMSKCTEIVQ